MPASMHEKKRDLFQRHFLLGELEPGEIDTLAERARVESYRAGQKLQPVGRMQDGPPKPAPTCSPNRRPTSKSPCAS